MKFVFGSITLEEAEAGYISTLKPVPNDPKELWSILHKLDASRFPSYEKFKEVYLNGR